MTIPEAKELFHILLKEIPYSERIATYSKSGSLHIYPLIGKNTTILLYAYQIEGWLKIYRRKKNIFVCCIFDHDKLIKDYLNPQI